MDKIREIFVENQYIILASIETIKKNLYQNKSQTIGVKMKTLKKMNHAEYPNKAKKYTIEQLRYIIADCREAINSGSGNASYYADEVHYCTAELARRTK